MNDGLRDLYQQVILEHYRKPHNHGVLESPTHSADGYNPLCGDAFRITLDVAEGRIRTIRFNGVGCAISTASASLMTDAVSGMELSEAERLIGDFQKMTTSDEIDPDSLGELAVLSGVRDLPVRIKCATLPWHALRAALHRETEAASTE